MTRIARIALSKSLLLSIAAFCIGYGVVAPLTTPRAPRTDEAWVACIGVLALSFRIIFRKELLP